MLSRVGLALLGIGLASLAGAGIFGIRTPWSTAIPFCVAVLGLGLRRRAKRPEDVASSVSLTKSVVLPSDANERSIALRAAVGTGILFVSFAAVIAGGRDYFGYTEDHFILFPALMFVVILCVIPLVGPYVVYWMGWKY